MSGTNSNADEFWKRFMWGILDARPSNIPIDEYLALVLSVTDRPITPYRTLKTFDIVGPALQDDVPGRLDTSKGLPRRCAQHSIIWARTDDNCPDAVDIEHAGRWWVVTREVWDKLISNRFLNKLKSSDEDL